MPSMHSTSTDVMEHENPKMTSTRSKFRRVGARINRIATHETSPVSRYPDPTPAELREFKALLASTGVDIGGGAYPTRDSVAFRGPGHEITGYVRNGKIIPPEVLRREDEARAARAAAAAYGLQRSSSYTKRTARRHVARASRRLQSVRVHDHDLVWWCDYMQQIDAEEADADEMRRREERRDKRRGERRLREERRERKAQQQEAEEETARERQRRPSFTSEDSRRCRLSMTAKYAYDDEGGAGGSSSDTLYSRPVGSQHGYYWNMPGEMGVLRVTNPDPVEHDEDEA